ncbi:FAD-dependent oxidoreductase, partial [Streptomyces albiflaviniger]|nr:FAD-dependent oxidoreductase [Streptomyces albiflaviniger]
MPSLSPRLRLALASSACVLIRDQVYWGQIIDPGSRGRDRKPSEGDGVVNDVVVVGAGPVGLLVAAELRLAGVDVTVIERAAARSPHSKALTLHPRSLEVLAMRGLAEPFVREGVPVPTGH